MDDGWSREPVELVVGDNLLITSCLKPERFHRLKVFLRRFGWPAQRRVSLMYRITDRVDSETS